MSCISVNKNCHHSYHDRFIMSSLNSGQCWSRKYLEISLHCLREWRRRFSDPIHHSSNVNRQTNLLPRDGFRAIHKQRISESIISNSSVKRCWRCTTDRNNVRGHLLLFIDRLDFVLHVQIIRY